MIKKNVLVFPCGSEIALEVYNSLNKSTYFNLIGGSSIKDHGYFVFKNYIGDIPFVNDSEFIPYIKKIVTDYEIDYIYPAMDSVITKLKCAEKEIGCVVVSSPAETTEICLSKEKTYNKLRNAIHTPLVYDKNDYQNIIYPVFCKPVIGYGARGARKIQDEKSLQQQLRDYPDSMILEYLNGDEYTVDCFTDKDGILRFWGPRKRDRISNGISVHTFSVADNGEFKQIVSKINNTIKFRGAWFVQLKRNFSGELVLLEIASRLGGSSSLFRAKGVNFAQLSLFDAMGLDIKIQENDYNIEMDRALDNKYIINVNYNEVFIDYDDTVILEHEYFNTVVMQFIYQCKNEHKKVSLLSSHDGNLDEELQKFSIKQLFDRVIQIDKKKKKSDFIDNVNSIFIDDSFSERFDVHQNKKIPVFSVDMVPCLIK